MTEWIRKGHCCQCGECCSNRTLMSDEIFGKIINAFREVAQEKPHLAGISSEVARRVMKDRNFQCR